MSAWAYCQHGQCGTPLGMATLAEAVAGRQECPRCHGARVVGDFERDEALRRAEERLTLLTSAVVMLGEVLNGRTDERPTIQQWQALLKELQQ